MKKINITSLAKKLNMSPSTVSRALNNSGRISKKTINKVKKTARECGYVPNIHAKRLLGGSSETIGVCCSNGFSFYYPDYYMLELIHALIEATANVNHNLVVFNTGEYKHLLKKLQSREIDGLIIIVDNPKACISLARKLSPYPCVILGCSVKKSRKGLSTVSIDRESGAESATEFLLKSGHKNIGFIRGIPADPIFDDKLAGYANALKNAGIKYKKSLIVDGLTTIETAIKAATKLIKKNVTAIFCETDWIALGTFRAAILLGKKIPDDVSVIGFNDCAFSANLTPPLSTVKIPLDLLANTATESLVKLILNQSNGEHSVIPTQLIIRDSVKKTDI